MNVALWHLAGTRRLDPHTHRAGFIPPRSSPKLELLTDVREGTGLTLVLEKGVCTSQEKADSLEDSFLWKTLLILSSASHSLSSRDLQPGERWTRVLSVNSVRAKQNDMHRAS